MLCIFWWIFTWPFWLHYFSLLNHNEAAIAKINCHLSNFPKQSGATHMCLHSPALTPCFISPVWSMFQTDNSTKAFLIVSRQRVLHAVMVLFLFSKLFTCVFPPSISSLFLCLSCACSLIGVVIITSRILPQALLYALITHTEPLFFSLAD